MLFAARLKRDSFTVAAPQERKAVDAFDITLARRGEDERGALDEPLGLEQGARAPAASRGLAERKRVGVADAVGLDGVSGTHEPEARDLRGLVGDASDVLARQGHARRLPSGRSYSNGGGGVTYLLVTRRWSVPAVRFGGQEHHISDRDQ